MSSNKRDYYEVLGIERSATDKTIAESYRKLAFKYHPDKNPGSEEAIIRFKEAAEAFEVLSDREKRSRYDRFGHAGVDGRAGGAPHFNDINDIFSAFGDIFGDGPLGDIFGGGRGRRQSRGADIHVQVTLTLVEAARGVKKTILFQRHEACTTCGGTGAKPGTSRQTCSYCGGRGQVIQSTGLFRLQTTCPSCQGAGSTIKDRCTACRGAAFTLEKVSREVEIPAGIDEQTRLRISGEGEPSPSGGPRGDLYCDIAILDHPLFQLHDQDLLIRMPISFSQAALGTTVEVPTLEGPHELVIPAGTQPGEIFKLRGLGLPSPRKRSKGSLIVEIQVEIPKHLAKRQEELLRELAELEQTHVSPHRKSFLEKVRQFFVPDEDPARSEE